MKKSIIKNISLGIACLLGVGGVVAAASIFNVDKPFEEARADGITYISRSWDGTKIDEKKETCTEFDFVNLDPDELELSTGWYVLNTNITFLGFFKPITINGNVNLILMDGRALTICSSIVVNSGNTLNIYSQSDGAGAGAINVTRDEEAMDLFAGIGSDENNDCGTINIYGGNVAVTGTYGSAGIGGSYQKAGGTVNIFGGTVVANGGDNAAGIGGGLFGAGGNVTIYGGDITATGGSDGAGIGGGHDFGGGTVNIHGGTVVATGGECGAGIGGGCNGAGGTVNIHGGTVTANGGSEAVGIGGGAYGASGTLNVDSKLTVLGGTEENPTAVIKKVGDNYERCRYMIVKDVPHVHDDITFKPWNSSDSLPTTGDYYLTTDVTLSGGWTVPEGVLNLCLNDYSITLGEKITVGTGCTLNIYDDGTSSHYYIGYDAVHIGGGNYQKYYGKVATQSEYESCEYNKGTFAGGYIVPVNPDDEKLISLEGGTINIHSGTFVGSKNVIAIKGYGNTINMTGGNILGAANGFWTESGEATISVSGGLFSANGGNITYTQGTTTVNLSGGRFEKNRWNGISIQYINLSGSPYVDDTDNHGGIIVKNAMVLTSPLTQGAHLDVYAYVPSSNIAVITNGWVEHMGDADPNNYFRSTNQENAAIDMYGEEVAIKRTYTITYDGNGATGGDVPANGTCIYGSSTITAANTGNLVRTGLFFGGWNTKQDPNEDGAVHYAVGDSIAIIADTTLYAEWTNHIHEWEYSSSGSTITAECHGTIGVCPFPENKATLTISAPSGDLTYDGSAKEASFVDTSSGVAFSNITITYTKGGEAIVGSPIDAGTYVATISFNEDATKTASIEYTISKAVSSLESNPTGVAGLIYNGNDQGLITSGTASGGELKYSLDGTNYSSSIPTGTNAGDYTVYYKVFGDSNHNDSEEQSLAVSISKATVDPVGTLNSTYGKTLGDVILPSGWTWDDPTATSVGNAGNQSFDATFAEQPNYKEAHQTVTINVATADPDPVGTLDATFGQKLSDVALPNGWAWTDATQSVGNVGSHDFAAHYTAVDTNHHDKDASITVNVSQATPTGYDIPTDLNATYGDTLSSIELPDTWAWKNPNDKVGNAGNQNHTAIYTPTDPNYKAVEETLTVSVAKANPTYTLPTDIEMYINETLSNVTLPSGFSWMDESIKASSVGENTFKVRYTPVDTTNYNVIENIDVKVNVKWKVVDSSSSSTSIVINGADEAYTTDISVKVEVKTDISVEQKHNEYASLATNNFVKSNEDIVEIYDVKLIRTTNGVEEEIQPSDIKPGTKIIISMAMPENLVGKDFRLLHIHNSDDITEVTNYAVSKDGKTLTVEVDRLSEFAFIGATDKDNGFIYNSTPIWALILLIIFSIILLVGIYYLYRLIKDRNDDSNNGDKSVKTMSITFISPILLAYLGLNGIIIAFIIVAALSVIVWACNLGLFISNKKRKHAKLDEVKEVKKEETESVEESKPAETVKEPEPVKPVVIAKEPEPINEDEEEVVTITDEKGNIFNIRYIKSFTAKLIQSPDETKKYYEELKNYVLSYKKTTSRVSWHYDSINSGRNQVLKFAIRGKTLCLYYPLNASDYEDSKYKVEAVDSKKFEEVPCLYRIKNDRRLGYAKDLIDTVMSNLGLVKGEEQHEVYSNLPYEPNAPLIARGLIKELKVQVNKPVEQVVSKKVNDEGDEIITTKDNKGNYFEIRYIKSFLAKLSQASDGTKAYYNELKNYVLTYKGVHSRVSWHFDSINIGRDQLLKFSIRGKTLCLYYALNYEKLDSKYKVEKAEAVKYQAVPCLYRIKNDRRFNYAKELIDQLMDRINVTKGKESNEDFSIPYEETKVLLAKGLIKEVKVQVNKPNETIIETKEDEEGNEVVISQDNKGNIYETRYVKSFLARLYQASDETKSYYKEIRNYILSYKGIDESISWLYDSINLNREQLIKLNIKSKALHIYLALDTSKIGKKYQVEASEAKKYSKVSCSLVVTSETKLKYAKELIERIMKKHKLVLGELHQEEYGLTYLDRDTLIKKGLIRETKIKK